MQEFRQEVKQHSLPYRDYRTFCLFSLFPEPFDDDCGQPSEQLSPQTHPLLSPFNVSAPR